MTPEEKKELSDFLDEFYKKNPWLESRLWDDKCICPDEKTVDPKCTNKRCREL